MKKKINKYINNTPSEEIYRILTEKYNAIIVDIPNELDNKEK